MSSPLGGGAAAAGVLRAKPSRLCTLARVEQRTEFEEALERSWQVLSEKTHGMGEREAADIFMSMARVEDKATYETLVRGLLYAVLTEPRLDAAGNRLNLLTHATGDQWLCCLTQLNIMLIDLWPKLIQSIRVRTIWLLGRLIKQDVPKVDNVSLNLLKTLSNGTDFNHNAYMADEILKIFEDNREWLSHSVKPKSLLPQMLAQTLLRLIYEHGQPAFEQLRKREIDFCVWLLTEKLNDCATAFGRDLVFDLMRVSRLPQFQAVWQTLAAPKTNAGAATQPTADNLWSILCRPMVQPSLQAMRVSWLLFRRVEFILKTIKLGAHQAHFDWIMQHFSSADGGSMRCATVRWIVAGLEPTQLPSVLVDGSMPVNKSHLLFHLMHTLPVSAEDMQLCRLALFWDWLWYEPSSTPVWLIDPAWHYLLLALNMKPDAAAGALDFLIRLPTDACPELEGRAKANLNAAFKALLDHKVTTSLTSVLCSTRLDGRLRAALRNAFASLLPKDKVPERTGESTGDLVESLLQPAPAAVVDEIDLAGSESERATCSDTAGANWSDDDEPSVPDNKDTLRVKASDSASARASPKPRPVPSGSASPASGYVSAEESEDEEDLPLFNEDVQPLVEQIDTRFRESVRSLVALAPSTSHAGGGSAPSASSGGGGERSADTEQRCECVEALCQSALALGQDDDNAVDDDLLEEQATLVARCLLVALRDRLKKRRLLFHGWTDESIGRLLEYPLFVLFRAVCEQECQMLRMIAGEMSSRLPRTSYLFLFYLKAAELHTMKEDLGSSGAMADGDEPAESRPQRLYAALCRELDDEADWDERIVNDLQRAAVDDYRLFGYLAPFILAKSGLPYILFQFSFTPIRLSEVLRVICGNLDSVQLFDLITEMVQGSVNVLKKENFGNVMKMTLSWETLEQYFFWQLATAQNASIDWIQSSIWQLKYPEHAEALHNVLFALRRITHEPNSPLLRAILCREPKPRDMFVSNALQILYDDFENELPVALGKLITKLAAADQAGQKPKKVKGPPPVTLDKVLTHLDRFRSAHAGRGFEWDAPPIKLLRTGEMLSAMQSARRVDRVQEKFSELFVVVEILSDRSKLAKHRGQAGGHAAYDSGLRSKEKRQYAQDTGPVKKKRRAEVLDDSD